MSLLIKALKQAEQKYPAGAGSNKATGAGFDLSLEPLAETGGTKHFDSLGAQTAGNYFAAKAPASSNTLGLWLDPRNWSLVPAALLIALLLGTGYGYYIYLMTRPPAPLAAHLNPVSAAAKLAAAPAPVIESVPDLDTSVAMKFGAAMKKPEPDEVAVAQAGSVPAAPVRQARAGKATRVPKEPSVVVSNVAAPQINPVAAAAYSALQTGRIDEAQSLYQKLSVAEPRNLDALLGMAAVALQKGHAEQAGKYYMQALEADPKNAAAQAGLISLIGSADPLASESRLKQLLANQPSAFLYFTLGNLHAEQGKWPAAEQAYFQAQQLEPANADYAFNLAVSLEHLNQPAIALTYYRHAQQFASRNVGVHFDAARLAVRIAQLASTSTEEKH